MGKTGYSPKDGKSAEELLLTLGGSVIGSKSAPKAFLRNYDCSIKMGKKSHRLCITFRNGYHDKFGEAISFIRLDNYLYMISPSSKELAKCKISRQARKDGQIHGYVIPHKDMTDLLAGFEGDYELQYDKKIGAYYIELPEEGE